MKCFASLFQPGTIAKSFADLLGFNFQVLIHRCVTDTDCENIKHNNEFLRVLRQIKK